MILVEGCKEGNRSVDLQLTLVPVLRKVARKDKMYVLVYVVAVLSVSVLMDVQWDTQTRLGRRILSELMVDFRKNN